jgi:very-short-patch-repair endonuclease
VVDLAALTDSGSACQGLVTRQMLRAAGLRPERLSRAARKGQLVLVRRRVYAREPLPSLPRFVVTDRGVAASYVLHVRAVLLSLGPTAAARGRTAAALRGWPLLVEPARTVEVAVPHGMHLRTGRDVKAVQCRELDVDELRPVDGAPLRVTTAARTLLDCATELPLVEAVVAVDSALRAAAVTVAELLAATASHRGLSGAARARRVLELCDPESGSVLESVVRVRMLLAGITGITSQRVICDAAGRHIVRADFCFDGARLVVEVDGHKWHQDASFDRDRDNRLAAAGWRVLRYTWADVMHNDVTVVRQIRAALDLSTESLQLAGAHTAVAA